MYLLSRVALKIKRFMNLNNLNPVNSDKLIIWITSIAQMLTRWHGNSSPDMCSNLTDTSNTEAPDLHRAAAKVCTGLMITLVKSLTSAEICINYGCLKDALLSMSGPAGGGAFGSNFVQDILLCKRSIGLIEIFSAWSSHWLFFFKFLKTFF